MNYQIEVNNGICKTWKPYCVTNEEYLHEHLDEAKKWFYKIRYREYPSGVKKMEIYERRYNAKIILDNNNKV